MECPRDNTPLEPIAGDFRTGVSSNGCHETQYQEGMYCPQCGTVYEESDLPRRCEFCGISWLRDERTVCDDCTLAAARDEENRRYWAMYGRGDLG